MVEKKFFLQSQNDIQKIGLRAQVVSFLIQEGIKQGNVLNDTEDKKRVIVAISISNQPTNQEVEIDEIEKIKSGLVKHLNHLPQSDSECYGQMPSDISATGLMDLNNPYIVSIVDLQSLSSALMLEQTSKGVGVMLGLKTEMLGLKTEFNSLATKLEPLGLLPEILEKLRKRA